MESNEQIPWPDIAEPRRQAAREVLRRLVEAQIGDVSRSLACVRELPAEVLAELIAKSDLRTRFARFAAELDVPEESYRYVKLDGSV
ncbi:hypothetical protein [Nocardia carnea]|uniref:hypothetical protein n=1 Tax=Nocardia carnea TaxID=37328 RepID=UPI00245725D9|nr:hypothetical protein [Nocardia carnea]